MTDPLNHNESINPGAKRELPQDIVASGPKPFTNVTQKVMKLVSSGNVGLDRIARNIETDPALACRTLRLANSSLYRRGAPCDTVSLAVIRVGSQAIYELVAAIATAKTYQAQTPAMLTLHSHALGVAGICRLLATEVERIDPDRAFLCGLLHDIGKLLCHQSGDLNYDKANPEWLKPGKSHLHERKHLGYDHAKLAAHALEVWQIPEPLPSAIALHHKPVQAYRGGGDVARLVTVLCAADLLDHHANQSEELEPAVARALAAEAPFRRMSVDHERLRALWKAVYAAKFSLQTVIDA
jgi:putative nucleotidyltransferase with HDIG domain